MVLNFVQYPDPRLTRAAEPRGFVDDELRAIGQRLLAAAAEARAYGLAAAHIGEIAPVVIVSGDAEGREYMLLFNPSVVAIAAETEAGEEGSVSAPGVRIQLDRPVWAEVAHMDESGASRTTRFEHFAARVALHEIEQMNGMFFLNKLSRLKRDMILKKARKLPG